MGFPLKAMLLNMLRGRLALPEMLAQFEREASVADN